MAILIESGGEHKVENITFLTGIANDFDVELAKILSENGYKVYSTDRGKAAEASSFATIINFDPGDADSIETASREFVENAGHIDLYIETSDYRSDRDTFTVSDEIDFDLIKMIYTKNVLQPIALYEAFLPLMKKGNLKRYAFITSADASVNHTTDTFGYGYNMSKAALHNVLQIMKNNLLPQGFTFRTFDPSGKKIPPSASSKSAFNYFTRRRGIEGRDDEPKLKIRDAEGREWSW